ncbi:hypothetical protein KSS87_017507 [Heliosperma pusillum]|nr:hypothetical protein KSS87_017507 [Heliosperma pusillum]
MTNLEIEQDQELRQQNFLLDCLYCEELYPNDDDDDNDDYSSSLEEEEYHFVSLLFNYFDKFTSSLGSQRERSWLMIQLAAVSSLSLASKFEEVDCKYIFEAKTIKRMELLILSTLEWNMNAVTPFSYFGYLICKLNLKNYVQCEISSKWQTLILSAITDPRFLHHDPSVIATTAMMQTMKELGLWKATQHQIHLIDTLKLNKDKVDECCKFIQEISSTEERHKRKCCNSGDSSPTRVLDLVFTETSKESLDQPVPKKYRTFESYT